MHRRAKFVWTVKQPIDGAAAFRVFLGRIDQRDDGKNRWYLLRRRLALPSPPDTASLTLTVDGRYQLFVNGTRIGRGPMRCSPLFQRTDTHDLRPWLRAGDNVVALLVHVYGVDTSWYEAARGQWQPVFGDGGFWCEGQARCGAETIEIRSDLEWRLLECAAWARDTPRSNWGLGFIEVHDARRMPVGWSEPGFDDSVWDAVQELTIGAGPPDAMLGGFAVEPFPTLVPRELPFLAESPVAAERVVRTFAVAPQPDLPIDRRIYEEALGDAPDGMVVEADALLRDDDTTTVVRTTADADAGLLVDFGRIHSGHPFIELDAEGGEVVEVAVAEGMPGEWDGGSLRQLRLSRDGGHGAHVFRYVARAGRQRFEKFEWSAVRWAQIVVRDAPRGLRIRHVGSTYTRYPVEPRGRFECSDPLLEQLWQVGRYTLQLCMHDGWEDCPGREQRQWLGDATVEYAVGQAAFGPSVNPLNRQFLAQAAESQRPDGLTQMFAPGDHRTNGILIPDWTLQWIINAEQHLRYSGELDAVEAIFPSIQKALAWFERQIGAHGLVSDVPYWHFHDWAALGRRGEAATLNAVLVGALRASATIARALESPRVARQSDELADSIGAALNARHWDEARGVYVDTIDPDPSGRTAFLDRRVSQHANGALILWDIAPRERWDSMIRYITDPARVRFTAAPPIAPRGEEFDPERHVVLANTFFTHFVYRALCRAGRFDLVLGLIRERYGRMLERGATTLWESYDPTASLCHGFSATPVYQLSAEVLGVFPLEHGFRRFRIAPQLADLEYARGVFPTVRGDVSVEWSRDGDTLRLTLTVPPGTEAKFVAPAGYASDVPVLAAGTHRLTLRR
jgi:hypothetical protein